MSENEIRHRTATRLRQGIILPPVVAFSLHFIFTPILFGKLSSSPLLFLYYALCLGTVLIIINIFIGKWKHGADIPLGKIYTRSYLAGVLMVGIGSQVALVLDGSISFQVIAIRAFWMLAIASLMSACTALWFTHQVRHMPAEDLAGSLSVPLRDKFMSVFLFIFLLSMTIVNVIHYKAEVRIVSAQKTADLREALTAAAQTVQNAFANHASLASDVAATEAPRGKKKRTDDAFALLYRDLPLPVARAAVFGAGATNAWERREDGLNPIDGGTWPQAGGFFADGTNMYYVSTAAAARSACILADARDIRQLMVTSFPGVKLYLADASGKTVVSSDGAMPVFTKHALASTNGHDMMAVGGKQHAVFAAPIASNAAVMLAVPATEIFAAKALDDVALYAALTLWISVIAVGAAVVIVLRIFLGPLERARDISRELAQGKGDLTRRISVKTNDEIGELLFYFNKFIDTMNFIVNNIKSGTMNLNTDLSRMQVTVEETAKVSAAEIESIERSVASVEEIMRSIGQVGTTTEQQKNAFASVNIAIDELLKSILRISENMQKQSVSISETSSAIEQMTSNILSVAKNVGNADAFAKRLLSEAKTGGDRVDDLVDAIREVEESSSQINEIITVIQSIAEQTNLLAMNAAIEAAHAGEHGKGFAVVADEIRKLAENTAANSQSITVIVKDIATRIEKIVGLAVESGTSLTTILDASGSTANIIAEITAANNELETGGRDILETVKNLNQITDEVKASVDEQMQSGNVVESQVTLLDRITTEVATSINENSIGAREITESMEELRAIAVKNKQGTSELSSAIGGIAENFSRFVSLVAAFKTSEAEKHPELESPTAARELPAPDDAAR